MSEGQRKAKEGILMNPYKTNYGNMGEMVPNSVFVLIFTICYRAQVLHESKFNKKSNKKKINNISKLLNCEI